MLRNRKLKPWEQEQADARKVREEAYEAAIKANPELYEELKNGVLDARDAYYEMNRKYHPLSQARAAAMNLACSLSDAGLSAEETIVDGLTALLERTLQPISIELSKVTDAYEAARQALYQQFPYEGAERRPDGL